MPKQKKPVKKRLKATSNNKPRLPKKIPAEKKNILKKEKKVIIKRPPVRIRKKPLQVTVLDSAYEEVDHQKFYTAVETKPEVITPVSQELPGRYDEDKIIIQVRDPWWLHAYWEVRHKTIEEIKARLGRRFDGAKSILRVYDVSSIQFNGKNAHHFFDIDVSLDISNWYLDVGASGRSWIVDVGFLLTDGSFILIARSNAVTTPTDGPSWMTDEEWMIPEDKFAALYGMGFGFGFGLSSPGRKGWVQRFKVPLSSPGLFSLTSPIRKQRPGKGRGFWFNIDAELIIHGATEPNAKVKVSGQPVELNGDGTFTFRYHLPDGIKTIPIEAQSFDGVETRSVMPVVSRETR